MKDNKFDIFGITFGIKPTTRMLRHIFFCKSYEEAKIYFHNYIKDEKTKTGFSLYKIAEITKDLKIKEVKIFVCGGYEITWKKEDFRNEMEKQRKLLYEKEMIEKTAKQKELKEQIKILFNGKEIEC